MASHRTASATGAAASGCPSAPTCPVSSASWPTTACAHSASTRPASAGLLDQLEPVATGTGPVAVPIDWEPSSSSGTRSAAIRRIPATATTTGRTVNDLKPWSNGGDPYEHDAALELAREHARDFVRRASAARRYRAARAAGLLVFRARHRAARPLVVRGGRLAARRGRGGRRARAGARDPAGGARAARAVGAAAGGVDLGAPARTSATWDSPAVAELAFDARAAELAHGRGGGRCTPSSTPALERAARELLAIQSSDWAFMVDARAGGRLPGGARGARTGSRLDAALAALTDSAAASGPAPCAAWRLDAGPLSAARLRRPDARPDPVLGVPAADRGRARAARPQAGREPRPRRASTCTCSPAAARSRPPRRRRGRARAPRARAEPPARAERVRHLGRAHEHRHAGRRRRAGGPLRLRRRARPRLARRRRRRPPRQALRRTARRHDPRDRVRPPPGLGRQAPAVATSTASSAGWRTAPSG